MDVTGARAKTTHATTPVTDAWIHRRPGARVNLSLGHSIALFDVSRPRTVPYHEIIGVGGTIFFVPKTLYVAPYRQRN